LFVTIATCGALGRAEVAEDFGIVELDEHGRRVGDFVSGAKLKALDPLLRCV
jgi:hypothetical protein